jgi:hypothetical protein
MKKIPEKYRVMSTRDDFPMTRRHIHFPRIRDFARNRIDFTEKETAHYEVCRVCRLKVIDALIRAPQVVRTKTSKAA